MRTLLYIYVFLYNSVWLMSKIYRIVTFLPMVLGIVAVAPVFWNSLKLLLDFGVYRWFYLGVGVYVLLLLLPFVRNNARVLETLSHEVTHAFVGLLFLKNIKSLKVSSDGSGEVRHTGNRFGATCISLSPYTLPLFTYILLIISLMVEKDNIYIFDIFVGFTFAFHIKCFVSQTSLRQTDITSQGIVRSFVFIALFLMFNTAVVLMSVKSGLADAVVSVVKSMWVYFIILWNKVF